MTIDTPLTVHEPAGTPKGGIVVVQEVWGVDPHIDDIGRRFAAEGWLAVAPHLFHRFGDPTFDHDDRSAAFAAAARLTPEGILDDLDAAFARVDAAGIPPDATGVVGYCLGGTLALIATAERSVGAGVTYYGAGITRGGFGFPPLLDEARLLEAPWLGLYGDQDRSIPVDEVEQLRAAAAQSGQVTEVVRYEDAGHAFNNDRRANYHEASAADAWRRTLAWFGQHLTSA